MNCHFSVGQNAATDLKTGTPTCTISSGVLTFSTPQTGNIGVGCKITYDTSKTCYISAKQSTSVWGVVTLLGASPTNEASPVTVDSIMHVFSSLSSAVSNVAGASYLNSSDWVTSQYKVYIWLYRQTGDDTNAVTLPANITFSASYNLNISTVKNTSTECNTNNWISGKKWTAGGYVLSVDNDNALNGASGGVEPTYVVIDRIQAEIGGNTTAGKCWVGYDNDNCTIKNFIFRMKAGATAAHSGTLNRYTDATLIANGIIYGFANSYGVNADQPGNGSNQKYMNISVYGCATGFYTGTSNTYQVGIIDNVICLGNTTDWNIAAATWTGGTGHRAENNIDGSTNVTSLNNQANNQTSKVSTNVWVDPANGDFNLKAGSAARLTGRTESEFTIDIDGLVRATPWDSGPIQMERFEQNRNYPHGVNRGVCRGVA